ncbi:MAG: acyltransferase [Pseudomonadota bacterium]
MTLNLRVTRSLANAIDSHDNGFNFVRLVCALLVVVFHAYQLNTVHPGALDPVSALVAPVSDLGMMAVGVFFLISGIFITQSWARDPHALRFALRRVARIVPGLFACLLISTVVAVTFYSPSGWHGLLDGAPWRYIFGGSVLHGLVYNIPPAELRIAGVLAGQDLNGPLWTLYWEGRMYVMVALVGMCAVLPMRTWLRGAAIFLLLAANLFPTVLSGYIWEVPMWSLFLSGMLLYTLAASVRVGWRHVACALVLIALNWTRSQAMTPSGLTFFGLALAMCALGLWAGTARSTGWAHLRKNDYSYGIYIWHWPVLLMLRSSFPALDALPLLAAGLAVIVPLAMLSWHAIEAPVLSRTRRLLRHRM